MREFACSLVRQSEGFGIHAEAGKTWRLFLGPFLMILLKLWNKFKLGPVSSRHLCGDQIQFRLTTEGKGRRFEAQHMDLREGDRSTASSSLLLEDNSRSKGLGRQTVD